MESWSKMNWGSGNSSQVLGELGAITDAFAGKFDRKGESSDFLWVEDSSSKFSGTSDSLLIDLKLGNVHNSEETMILSSSESVARSKKVRVVAVSNQVAYCQVYGCNKDLSSSKDYHKRHKVCDVHSKTPKVIVNGIEQRFCQQCSRFHLLSEFDEGKRSCRKRLAGHNERRRKPQFSSNMHQGRATRLLSPYSDGRLQGNTFSTPFICSDILHDNTFFRPIKYGRNDYYGNYRSAEEDNANNYGPIPVSSFQYQQLQPRLPFPYIFEKKPAPNSNTTRYTSSLGMMFTGGPYQEQQECGGGSNSSDLSIFDTTTASDTMKRFSGISESGCALSLLSSQSQNSSSSHATGILIGEPRYSIVNQDKHNLVAMISNGGGLVQGSNFNAKECGLPSSIEDGATIDLLQLSSKLQQVQQERQESHTFFF